MREAGAKDRPRVSANWPRVAAMPMPSSQSSALGVGVCQLQNNGSAEIEPPMSAK